MCIIAVSPKGHRQPTEDELINMFTRNPHGAGYMYARDGIVHIHKGFMDVQDYLRTIKSEHFTKADSVVYHCRISTQAGVNPEMTHPFPLTKRVEYCKALDVDAPYGVAHNGIIHLEGCNDDHTVSDTVHFITKYMTRIIRTPDDVTDPYVIAMLEKLSGSKLAIMDNTGYVCMVGKFVTHNGCYFSNDSFRDYKPVCNTKSKYSFGRGCYDFSDYFTYDYTTK